MSKYLTSLIFIFLIIGIVIAFILIPVLAVKSSPTEYTSLSIPQLTKDRSSIGVPYEVDISVVENSNPDALVPFYISTNDSSVGKYFINCISEDKVQTLSSVPILVHPMYDAARCIIIRYD
jgi:hypothetical protein